MLFEGDRAYIAIKSGALAGNYTTKVFCERFVEVSPAKWRAK